MKRYTPVAYFLGALVFGICFGQLAMADAVRPQVCGDSDCMVVFDGQGNVFNFAVANEANENTGDFHALNVPINQAQFGTPTLLIEPDTSQTSDIFGVCTLDGGNTFSLCYNSDTESQTLPFGPSGFPNSPVFTENTAGPYDATIYLDPTFAAGGFTAQFWSDTESTVPEPTTLLLVGSGLLAAARARKRFTS